jgi:SpoVK/Ycf46/Vps4 family AAA+-type ATPase
VGEGLPPSFCAAMVTPAAVSAAAAALRWLALATEAVGRSSLWQNALFQAAVLPLLAVQLRRWFRALSQSVTDCIFTQVRFRDDAELRSFISHKLQNSRAGYRVSTLDEEHGAAEILQENNVELCAYTLHARGAAPLHVTHMPLEAASSWLWLAQQPPRRRRESTGQQRQQQSANMTWAPWWSLPIVWICPENVDSPLWQSLPRFVKAALGSATSFLRSFLRDEGEESHGGEVDENRLVVSTFRWHGGLVDIIANDAARFGEQSRTRSCPILHLRSDGVRRIVAPPRRMSTVGVTLQYTHRHARARAGAFIAECIAWVGAPGRADDGGGQVVLAPEGEALLTDIAAFFARREWYRRNDLPYQRIYLLHGPPGNGKSSFLQALAIMFSMPFFYLELANKQLTLEGLRNMLRDNTLQSRCILALEDAESVFKKETPAAEAAAAEREAERLERMFTQQQAQQAHQGGGPSGGGAAGQAAALAAHYGVSIEDFTALVSGDLNPPNGRLIFLTTNHVDRMHSDLLRLVDEQGMRVHFPNASLTVIHGMFTQFFAQYPMASQHWTRFQEEYTRQYGRRGEICSAAAIQEYLMSFRTNPELAAQPASVAQLRPKVVPQSEPEPEQEQDTVPHPATECCSSDAPDGLRESLTAATEYTHSLRPQRLWATAFIMAVVAVGAGILLCKRQRPQKFGVHPAGDQRAAIAKRSLAVVAIFLRSLKAEHGRVAQGVAAAVAAMLWVGLSQFWDFVSRSVWATYILPLGRDEQAGTWILDALRAQLARGGADRLDALPKTDTERLGSAVRTIELRSSRFAELSTQHFPLEAKIERGRAYRLHLAATADSADSADSEQALTTDRATHTVWVTEEEEHVTMQFLQGGRGWFPTPWMSSVAAHAIARRTVHRARQAFCTARALHTNVYRFSVRRQRWQKDKPPPERLRDASFIAPSDSPQDSAAQRALANDALEFFGLRKWYRERGIPYRRGYLLHGEKGCGKSYFVRKMCASAGVPIYVLDIGKASTMTNESLPAHMHNVEANAVVVLKNIDVFVGNRQMARVSKELTFSGLLNVLDGALGANKGLIMVLTTNRLKRLTQDTQSADALLRPGRVSLLGHFGHPTTAQLRVYFRRLFSARDGDDNTTPVEEAPWIAAAAETFLGSLKSVFPMGSSPPEGAAEAGTTTTAEGGRGAAQEKRERVIWRCPWSWQEVKGLLMQPAARDVAVLSAAQTTPTQAGDHHRQWVGLIREFALNVRATRRARLTKTLEQHAAVLKRELRRPIDVASERLERERGESVSQPGTKASKHARTHARTHARGTRARTHTRIHSLTSHPVFLTLASPPYLRTAVHLYTFI